MIKPFADDEGSVSIAGLTVENGVEAVVISGNLEVTRDKAGLKHAQALKALAESLVDRLQNTADLPEKASPTEAAAPESVSNPFA